jgi:hypothetical protein
MTSDLRNLLKSVDDRVLGDDNRTKLYDLLTVRRLPALQVGTRVALVNVLQQGRTGRQEEEALCNVFLGTQGSDLTVLKNAIDAGDDYRDLQQLLFSDLDDSEIRKKILVHLERQGQANPCQVVKALSDIDDTFYANLKDKRYLKRTTYPGVVQYYEELVRGPGEVSSQRGNLVFLTARPKDRSGAIEEHTKQSLSGRGIHGEFTVLSGDFFHLIGDAEIAEKKHDNFVQYQQLFPEYGFVFTGDSGQGDAIFGEKIHAEFPQQVRSIFIHDVVNTSQEQREDWRGKGVIFFDTYVGAAVEAWKSGLISKEGVQRVITAARSEIQAMAFADAQQKRDREADLERDVKACRGSMSICDSISRTI